ncbi:MAG: hypothetical protein WKG06_45900 [Segetibacter sp.]
MDVRELIRASEAFSVAIEVLSNNQGHTCPRRGDRRNCVVIKVPLAAKAKN